MRLFTKIKLKITFFSPSFLIRLHEKFSSFFFFEEENKSFIDRNCSLDGWFRSREDLAVITEWCHWCFCSSGLFAQLSCEGTRGGRLPRDSTASFEHSPSVVSARWGMKGTWNALRIIVGFLLPSLTASWQFHWAWSFQRSAGRWWRSTVWRRPSLCWFQDDM